MNFDNLKAELRGILLANIKGVPLNNILREYENTYCKNLNCQHFGFSDLVSLLNSIPDVARIMKDKNGKAVVRGIALNDMNVIASKAALQIINPSSKSASNNTGRGRQNMKQPEGIRRGQEAGKHNRARTRNEGTQLIDNNNNNIERKSRDGAINNNTNNNRNNNNNRSYNNCSNKNNDNITNMRSSENVDSFDLRNITKLGMQEAAGARLYQPDFFEDMPLSVSTNNGKKPVRRERDGRMNGSRRMQNFPQAMTRENLCMMYHDLFVNVAGSSVMAGSQSEYYRDMVCCLRDVVVHRPSFMDVMVSHIEGLDSSFFWAIIISPEELSSGFPMDACRDLELAKYSFRSRRAMVLQDSFYCRAWVKSVNRESAVLHLVDTGDTAFVELDSLRDAPAHLWKHPPSAVPFKLIEGTMNKRFSKELRLFIAAPKDEQDHIFYVSRME